MGRKETSKRQKDSLPNRIPSLRCCNGWSTIRQLALLTILQSFCTAILSQHYEASWWRAILSLCCDRNVNNLLAAVSTCWPSRRIEAKHTRRSIGTLWGEGRDLYPGWRSRLTLWDVGKLILSILDKSWLILRHCSPHSISRRVLTTLSSNSAGTVGKRLLLWKSRIHNMSVTVKALQLLPSPTWAAEYHLWARPRRRHCHHDQWLQNHWPRPCLVRHVKATKGRPPIELKGTVWLSLELEATFYSLGFRPLMALRPFTYDQLIS